MKKQFIIANWKSHKTLSETKDWFHEFSIHSLHLLDTNGKEAIVCPPFPLLPFCKEFIGSHGLSVSLGAQDISPFPEGAYTGAVSGKLLRETAMYTIIGHSERRQYFHETVQELSQKVIMALSVGITPIYCLSQKEEKVPEGVKIVAYEPVEAIGSGKPDDPQDAESVAHFIIEQNDVVYVLYGGSVTSENVSNYTSLPSVNGVLVGGASLSPEEFAKMIQHA